MKSIHKLVVVFSLLLITACDNSAEKYLNEALDVIQENSIQKYTMDWDTYRKKVLEKGKDAKNIEETYPAILYAIELLDDHHSRFRTLEEDKKYYLSNVDIPEIIIKHFNNNIGYINIPRFRGGPGERSEKFATQIQNKIRELDNYNIKNWIVDLSDNKGGYVWPMILGLGPIFGEGTLGYLVDADTNFYSWEYIHGGVFYNNKQFIKLENPYRLKNKIQKLVVIIGKETASAGEALAVSFKGTENSLFIGSSTFGVSNGTTGYKLSDGAVLFVTRTKFVDRNMNIYGDSIIPDIQVSRTDAEEFAVCWINEN